MADEKWKDVTFNIPSLLPLQPPPQEEGKTVNYLQALHNYLAGDRLSIARAINVLAYYRTLFGITEDLTIAKPANTMAIFWDLSTGRGYYDSDVPTGVPAWNPLVTDSSLLPGVKNVVAVPVITAGSPPVNLDPHVVVDELPGDTSALDQPFEFTWDLSGDILMALEEVS